MAKLEEQESVESLGRAAAAVYISQPLTLKSENKLYWNADFIFFHEVQCCLPMSKGVDEPKIITTTHTFVIHLLEILSC